MTSYPNSAKEWKRRQASRMAPRDWVDAVLVVCVILALCWAAGAWVGA
jgi:hypothetical protein